MDISIADSVVELFPEAVVGIAVARGVDNRRDDPTIGEGLALAASAVASGIGHVPIVEHPHVAPWREAYRRFGAKPKKYQSSIESLVRRVVSGEPPRRINALVDLYNTVSLRFLVPVGGEDLDAVTGDIVLTVATGDEAPVRLLGEPDARPPGAGEVIYRDDVGAMCRRWNWKEADRTKLTAETSSVIFVIEALPPVGRVTVVDALEALAALVRSHCGGTVSTAILDRAHRSAPLA